MKLLAIDTSSRTASCAVVENGILLGEFYANIKLTHSCVILPMVQDLLARLKLSVKIGRASCRERVLILV